MNRADLVPLYTNLIEAQYEKFVFYHFFSFFLLTRNFLQIFVKIAICGQYHPRFAVLLLPVEF
jgi:hypothetical protein